MLDTIYISKNLPNEVQSLLTEMLGKIFDITYKDKASLYILNHNDKPNKKGFMVVYVDNTKPLDKVENCDYFQPYKYNDTIKTIDPKSFLNLVEYHIERLKLSPVVPADFETIFACD